MPNTEQFGSGVVPRKSDTRRMLLVKTLKGVALALQGTGSPEGVVTAPVGSIYQRTDGGANTSLYVKESGSGATGWVGK